MGVLFWHIGTTALICSSNQDLKSPCWGVSPSPASRTLTSWNLQPEPCSCPLTWYKTQDSYFMRVEGRFRVVVVVFLGFFESELRRGYRLVQRPMTLFHTCHKWLLIISWAIHQCYDTNQWNDFWRATIWETNYAKPLFQIGVDIFTWITFLQNHKALSLVSHFKNKRVCSYACGLPCVYCSKLSVRVNGCTAIDWI